MNAVTLSIAAPSIGTLSILTLSIVTSSIYALYTLVTTISKPDFWFTFSLFSFVLVFPWLF